ncbi:MAG TPA: AAA family ATPase [Nocardioidaceae bacterium]|nr:AAA family ATPase [Nocardioidaceae bacterium]
MDLLEREPHLAVLRAAYSEAVAGRGSVVLVEGEPGIGKTSLVSCFAQTLGGEARVLCGGCDDLSIPRPFAPLVDLTGEVSTALADELRGGSRPDEVRLLMLAELSGPEPTVLVLEDLHWADAATLDLVTVVGRRIAAMPALLVLTYRGGEVAADHPLWRALAALSRDRCRQLTLAPLSREAVAVLVGGEVDRVFAMTGGNPFLVAELAASEGDALPLSVSNAVLGRAARLPEASRRLLELVSMVPSQVAPALLDRLVPGWADAAEEPERRQLLSVGPRQVRFRHELVRAAIRSSVPVARRRELHARILRALLDAGADAADIVHHAEEAGDLDTVAAHAPAAARRAAASGANREAYAHFSRAVEFADRWDVAEQARLHEELADSAYAVDRLSEALPELEQALALYRGLGDREAVARCLRRRSRFHWYAGEGTRARADAAAAVETAESLADSPELARACAAVAQLSMLAGLPEARRWGDRAVALAERSGDHATHAHALVTLGVSRTIEDPDDWMPLLAAHETADRLGERHEAARALVGLVDVNFCWVQPALAERFNQRSLAYCREYQVDTLLAFETAMEAWLQSRRGEWAAAYRTAAAEAARGSTVTQILAELVLAEVALRRGDPHAGATLEAVHDRAERSDEIQWIGPVVELEVEQALLHDGPLPGERLVHAHHVAGAGWATDGWGGPRLSGWAALAGVDLPGVPRQPAPHAAMARHDWIAAAAAYAEVGWAYDQALMLSLVDDEAALGEALSIARRLGAQPLTIRVQRRMRALGLRVRRGPQRATRANAAGLTVRELEVLRLLAEGLTNTEIADRLTLSPRTAERHVSAVLGKLGVDGRRQAVQRAAGLDLLHDPGDPARGAG